MILVLFLKELCDAVALVVNNLPANARNAGDEGSIPGLERSPGEGNGNPLQYFCLENPVGRGAWRTWGPQKGHGHTVHGVAKSWARLGTHAQEWDCWVIVERTKRSG